MRNTQSIILGDGGVGKVVSANPSIVSRAEHTTIPDKVEPLPASSNGYAQEAAKVNTVNDAVQGRAWSLQSENATNSAPTEVSEYPKIKSLADFTNEIYKDRMPSGEDLVKEKKREKSRAVISAIADGVSAISNLYFTSKGATNVEQTSMSAANTKRYQEILDRRRKMKGEWNNARLAAYDRDRGFEHQVNRDKKSDERYVGEWNRNGRWHDDAVAREDAIRREERERRDRIDREQKEDRDRVFTSQEKAQKDVSARGWAAVGAQNKRIEAQDRKQKEQSKYQFDKMNGSPEPKMIGEGRSVYVGRNTWEQNSGQIAREIYDDLLTQDAKLAKAFGGMVGLVGRNIASTKETAAVVDKFIMRSPRAQQLAIDLERDYKKRYKLAANGVLPQSEDDPYGKYATEEDPYAKYAE